MNELQYLDHLARVKSDAIPATVESANEDGTYMVRTVGSRALRRASKANPMDAFKKGQRVMISEPSASRTVLGSEAIIQTRAPRDQRGLSGSTPAEAEDSHDASFILSVDPDPLVLVLGGDPGVQTITGRGFTSAATYASRDGLAEPTLTEVDAPTVDPVTVVMSIRADGDSPLGNFDASIGTAKARNALQVIRAGPLPPYYIVSGEVELVDTSTLAVLWVLKPDTLELLARFEVPADRSFGLTQRGREIYWITKTGADYMVGTINPVTGQMTAAPLNANPALSLHAASQLGLSVNGYQLLLGSVDGAQKGMHAFSPASDTIPGGLEWNGAREWTDVAPSTGMLGFATNAAALWMVGFNGTVRLDNDTYAEEGINASVTGSRIIVIREWTGSAYGDPTGQLCVAGGLAVQWIDWADLSVDETFTVGGAEFRGPVQIEDSIYFYNVTSGLLHRADLDGSTVDDVETIALLGDSHGAVQTDGADVFFLGSDGAARRMDVDGALLATSAVLSSRTPSTSVDLLQALYVD